ncbi:P-loop NTPase fold protein [Mucilaginibacter sabulilitoris]|uniref:P-loop NTPase fold protein n=1 Tax=Mucilaginibacter sabulilitoris TaxID=1173583 RepID=A0ABZ0TP92_9SPHI|nr:P-loop NTPase fold protein [Mucilaginibacter sabulilitoris]WPU94737.1 P-loop NTPase fold protein [Mucilaginibacter sabulilitoris]
MDLHQFSPSQQEAISNVLGALQRGQKKVAISMPVGTGKITVMLAILQEYLKFQNEATPGHVLVLTGSKLLQMQIAERLHPGPVVLELSDLVEQDDHSASQILVLNIQWLYRDRNMAALRTAMPSPTLILYDSLPSASPLVKQMLAQYENAIHLQATNDTELDGLFGDPVFIYALRKAIEDKFFVPIHVKKAAITNSLGIESAAELTSHSASAKEVQAYLESAVSFLLKEINGEKTIVYCPTISLTEDLKSIINQQVGKAHYAVSMTTTANAKTPSDELRAYKSEAEPVIICTVSLNPLAADLPCTRHVAVFHKTDDISVVQSMLIPALRPFPDKQHLQVLDFVGMHDLFRELGAEEETADEKPDAGVQSVPSEDEYFTKSVIHFRDKKDIEGVMGVNELSAELAEIIQIMPPEQGSMIGIFGKWGRGKSFLLEETWKKLKTTERFERVDFHAWKFQDTPASWAYLYECLADVYLEPIGWFWPWTKLRHVWRQALLNFKRKGVLPLIKFLTIVSAGIIGILLSQNLLGTYEMQLQGGLKWIGLSFPVLVFLYTLLTTMKKEYSVKAKDLFLKYSTRHSYKEHLGLQAEIQKETIKLLKTWIPKRKVGKKKILLLVEDLDRCQEAKIIQIIDSLRVLLEEPQIAQRIIIVTAVDERILKMAIKLKYQSLVDLDKQDANYEKNINLIVKEHIDKLFISGLKLGPLSAFEADDFFSALTKQDRPSKPLKALAVLLMQEQVRNFARYSQEIQQNTYDDPGDPQGYDYYDEPEPDYAIDYLDNSDLLPESTESPTERVFIDLRIDSLSIDEIDILRVSVTKFTAPTPRQLRIFYYRYLIAKNLLIRRYAQLHRNNVWQKKNNCRTLADLIVAYTLHEKENVLTEHLDIALKDDSDFQYVKLVRETVVAKIDYCEVLKVLSIVIAY